METIAHVLLCVAPLELGCFETSPTIALHAPSTAKELDDLLNSEIEWAALIASDAFCVAAYDVVTAFRERAPYAPALTAVDFFDPRDLDRALELRTHLVRRPLDAARVERFVDWVADGLEFGAPGAFREVETAVADAGLTPRERAVFAATMVGATKREISSAAGVSVTTVKSQRQSATNKIGARRAREIRRLLLERIVRRV